MSAQDRIIDIMRFFRVKRPVNIPMVRIGRNCDGGYVLCDHFKGIDAVISIGIEDEVSFDHQLAEKGMIIYQFDHTVDGPPVNHQNFRFHKLAWTPQTSSGSISLVDILSKNEIAFHKDMILKFDVEWSEWNNLADLPVELFSKFRMIVGEFHGLTEAIRPEIHAIYRRVFEKLTKNHTVIHIHANNSPGLTVTENVAMPDLLEITFCRNDDIQFYDYNGPLPCELDYQNDYDKTNIILRV